MLHYKKYQSNQSTDNMHFIQCYSTHVYNHINGNTHVTVAEIDTVLMYTSVGKIDLI